MEPADGGERQRRGACLSILLTGAAVCIFLLLLVFATGGWAIHVVWIGVAIVLFGLIHYAVWGQWMLRQTAGEREEEEVRQKAEARQKESGDDGSGRGQRLP